MVVTSGWHKPISKCRAKVSITPTLRLGSPLTCVYQWHTIKGTTSPDRKQQMLWLVYSNTICVQGG